MTRTVAIAVTTLAAALSASTALAQERNDCREIVLHNGKIATMDASSAIASSVTVRDDRIVAVGTGGGIPQHDPCALVIDLGRADCRARSHRQPRPYRAAHAASGSMTCARSRLPPRLPMSYGQFRPRVQPCQPANGLRPSADGARTSSPSGACRRWPSSTRPRRTIPCICMSASPARPPPTVPASDSLEGRSVVVGADGEYRRQCSKQRGAECAPFDPDRRGQEAGRP